jgi:hypothetical protein
MLEAEAAGVTRTYDKPVPALPPPGKVRIVAEKVREDATTVHWKWTVVGDRNWAEQTGAMDLAELKGAYPLDAANRAGGTNAYECEFALSTGPTAGGKSDLTYTQSLTAIGTQLSGAVSGYTGGGGSSGSGTLWSGAKPVDLARAVKVLVTGDQTLPLPLDVVLVEVTGEAADGTPLRHSYRLKAPE